MIKFKLEKAEITSDHCRIIITMSKRAHADMKYYSKQADVHMSTLARKMVEHCLNDLREVKNENNK